MKKQNKFAEKLTLELIKQEQKIQYKSTRNMTAKEKNEVFDLELELPKLDEEIEKLKEKLSILTTEYVQMMEIQKEIDELTEISEEKQCVILNNGKEGIVKS